MSSIDNNTSVPISWGLLEHELQGTKGISDKQWLYLSQQGVLYTDSRPGNCFTVAWEWLTRLFTNKMARLESKIVIISTNLEQYLNEETDESRLSSFLNTHTKAINALFRAAHKLKASGKFTDWAASPGIKTAEWMMAKQLNEWNKINRADAWVTVDCQSISGKTHICVERDDRHHTGGALDDACPIYARFYAVDGDFSGGTRKNFPQPPLNLGGTYKVEAIYTHSSPLVKITDHIAAVNFAMKGSEISVETLPNMGHSTSDAISMTTAGISATSSPTLLYRYSGRSPHEPDHPEKLTRFPVTLPRVKNGVRIGKKLQSIKRSLTTVQLSTTSRSALPLIFGCKAGHYELKIEGDGSLSVASHALRVVKTTKLMRWEGLITDNYILEITPEGSNWRQNNDQGGEIADICVMSTSHDFHKVDLDIGFYMGNTCRDTISHSLKLAAGVTTPITWQSLFGFWGPTLHHGNTNIDGIRDGIRIDTTITTFQPILPIL